MIKRQKKLIINIMNTPTKNTISPIINISELFQIRDKDELLIIDATNGKDAKRNYEKLILFY